MNFPPGSNPRTGRHAWIFLFLLLASATLETASTVDTQRVNFERTVRNKKVDDDQVLDYRNFQRECSFTQYPETCLKTISPINGFQGKHEDLVAYLVEKTIDETKMNSKILPHKNQLESLDSQHSKVKIGHCVELMDQSVKRLNQSLIALRNSPKKSKEDIKTWLSAVLTYQESCRDSLQGLTGDTITEVSGKMDQLSRLASNSLALANRITSSGKHRPEYTAGDSFPTWVSGKDRKLLQSTGISADAVVAQDGTGQYSKIADAVKSATGGRYVIYVKAGVYKEKIVTNKDGITLIGDGKYTTVITGDDSVGGGSSMPGSATFAVTGDGFIAKDIGFQNTAGPGGEQALALRIASDHSVLYRCSLVGYQDTLYALALRQFYRDCDIAGTIDFIFGNAAAVFQNCNLLLRRPASTKHVVAILANGRSDSGQNTGFSVHNSKIMATSDLAPVRGSYKCFLGRPWKQYSRSVVMQSSIDGLIQPRGWVEWDGNFALKTLYFGEYLNSGPGAGTSGRVDWPGFQVMDLAEASKFTVGNFISGSSWLPSTGVEFQSGLG